VDVSLGIPSDTYDESSAKEAIQKAKEIIKWIKKNL
jgi:HEPN domain-containing protein